MFGTTEIAKCKSSALIINTARGDVVDLVATCLAVRERRLGGFASDVFPDEPYDMTQWTDLKNIYFTPHIGGNAREAVQAMGQSAIAHVRSFLIPPVPR